MIGRAAFVKRGYKSEAEKPFWISYADLMTALMVLFLVVMGVALLAVTKTVTEQEKLKKKHQADVDLLLEQFSQAAARYDLAVSTVVHWVRRFRSTGSVAPSQIGGYKPRTLRGEHAEWLRRRCLEKDFTISQLVEELREVRGLKVDRRSVWEFLHAEELSFKKKPARQ